MKTDLINKYRPQTFEEFFGSDTIPNSLRGALDKGTARSFLFVGPSGCGKTTLARLVGIHKSVPLRNIIEVDAATHSGADSVRSITEGMKYKAFGKNPNKLIIIDECQSLSKKAWEALLKSIEEPPEHVYWCLCTTEVSKVPATIKTRCVRYDVVPLGLDDIYDLVVEVASMEGFQCEDSVLRAVAQSASGSPRQALVNLGKVESVGTLDDARTLLADISARNEVVDLCRELVKMSVNEWKFLKLKETINRLEGQSPESIRIVVTNYVAKVLSKESSEMKCCQYLKILQAFGEPFRETDKLAPIYLAVFGLIYTDDGD